MDIPTIIPSCSLSSSPSSPSLFCRHQLCTAMQNPSIPRSSDSSISKSHLLSSGRSSKSSLSSSSKPSWGKKKLKQALPSPGRNSSRHSDLTEESLHEHNRRNNGGSGFGPSPYYKGLTDFSLDINRQRAPGSPGRESHATTVGTSTSIISNISMQIKAWASSCFTSKSSREKDDDDNDDDDDDDDTKLKVEAKPAVSSLTSLPTSSSSSKKGNAWTLKKEESSSLGVNKDDVVSINQEKPLRERVSEVTVEVPAPIISRKRVVFVETGDAVNDENGKNKDFTWADKYRPNALKDFICNRDKAVQLRDLVKIEQPHRFIFEGHPGVGKRTMISAFLREAFGHGVQTREECKEFSLKGESIGSIQVNVKISTHHIEVNLSELKGYEKQVIVQLIQETCNKKPNKAVLNNQDNIYAIVLYEAEKLSTEALLYFRWLLEKHEGCRVFFGCSDISKLQPIKPLCTVVQLLPPSDEEIVEVLEFIAKQESIDLPRELAKKIAGNSKNNLRQAIRSFEATWKFKYPFEEDQEIRTGWEDDIAKIAKNIIEEQSPKQLYNIRGKLQKLIEHNVASEFIFKTLVAELKKQLDCSSLQFQFDSIFEDFHREDGSVAETDRTIVRNRHEEMGKRLNDPMRKNAHDMLKIEESIAKFMSCYKSQFVNNQGKT